jgi:hypothetical protein
MILRGEARSSARSKNELKIYTVLTAIYHIGHVTEDIFWKVNVVEPHACDSMLHRGLQTRGVRGVEYLLDQDQPV